MADEQTHSITELIQHVQSPDLDTRSKARQAIYDRYTLQLFEQAKAQLNHKLLLRGIEPQAVADSALMAFFKKEHPKVVNRDSLLGFLITVIGRKCINAYRSETADIRDVRKEEVLGTDADEHHAILGGISPARAPHPLNRIYNRAVPIDGVQREDDDFFDDDIIRLMAHGATPQQGAILNEMVESLPPDYQDIVVLKLQGRSTRDIAGQLKVSVNLIEQSLRSIESHWAR